MATRGKGKEAVESAASSRHKGQEGKPPVAAFLAELIAEAEAAQDRLDFASSLGVGRPEAPEAPLSRRTRRPRGKDS